MVFSAKLGMGLGFKTVYALQVHEQMMFSSRMWLCSVSAKASDVLVNRQVCQDNFAIR